MLTQVKVTAKHVSNRPLTFVTNKRFAVLFFLPSSCVNCKLINDNDNIHLDLHKSSHPTQPHTIIVLLFI